MPFLSSIKRAFGFSVPELEEAELEGIDATVVPLKARSEQTTYDTPSASETAEISDSDGVDTSTSESTVAQSQTVPSEIFETVVKVFNDALPAFLRDSVDPKAQSEYIYRQLDESMKLYLEHAASDARKSMSDRWETERRQMQSQLSTLQAKLQKDAEESNETKKQHLSAERQKRALGERVRDLEAQLQKAEAENEQLSLENKSMANKLRVSSVLGTEAPDADYEAAKALALKVNELTAQLEAANTAMDQVRQELTEAKTLADSRKTELSAAIEARDNADNETQRIGADLAKEKALRLDCEGRLEAMTKALDESHAKDNLGDAMLTDLNSKLGKTQAALEASENRCRDLEADNTKLNSEFTKQQKELAEAIENLTVVEQMQVQLTQLEDSRKNTEIYVARKKEELLKLNERNHQLELETNELKSAVAHKDSTILHLESVADSLRKTIEANLYEHAQCQSGLRAEIERLKKFKGITDDTPTVENIGGELGSGLDSVDDFAPKSNPDTRKAKSRNSSKNKSDNRKLTISAIDESIEDTDWLVATPPEPKKPSPDEESDFGYKAPQQKPTPENPDQMLLF